MSVQILCGDAREVLKTLPAESAHVCITSPPFWNLRDYGTAQWEGGDPSCDHIERNARNDGDFNARTQEVYGKHSPLMSVASPLQFRGQCGKCGAVRVDQQIGLESTVTEYVAALVEVFREVWRVLRSDGTLWLNLGDTYASAWPCSRRNLVGQGSLVNGKREARPARLGEGLKEKDLIGVPWRVAFALQEQGWYLRSDIIFSKPAPMPESVTDRPTRSHEYVFLLTKSERYFWDQVAVAEPAVGAERMRGDRFGGNKYVEGVKHSDGSAFNGAATRNIRSVWTIPPQPLVGIEHYAAFPERLVEICLLAGTSEKGCCSQCLAPWFRERDEQGRLTGRWIPGCDHGAQTIACTVLDPFCGSGTTLRVALKHRRYAIGIELNSTYCTLIEKRLNGVQVTLPLEEETA